MEAKTNSKEETKELGKKIAKSLKSGDVVALYGDLGSGKTMFVQGIAEGLGIKKRILSPTFVFLRSYPIKLKKKNLTLNHFDLYRMQSNIDAQSLGLDEILGADSINIIEWAEKIQNNLPEKRIDIKFEATSENERRITIRGLK